MRRKHGVAETRSYVRREHEDYVRQGERVIVIFISTAGGGGGAEEKLRVRFKEGVERGYHPTAAGPAPDRNAGRKHSRRSFIYSDIFQCCAGVLVLVKQVLHAAASARRAKEQGPAAAT
mgnify:FL=1